MLRTTAIVLCFYMFAGSAAAQPAPQGTDAATQEVRRAVRALADAYAHRDTAAVLRLEAAEAMTYYPDGTAGSRADDLALLRSDSATIQSIQQDSINVRVYGGTAVVTLRRTLAGHVGSTDISGQYKALAVWVRRDGRWQFVAESLNRLDRR
jgi:ketosteroid isomerase-like protein